MVEKISFHLRGGKEMERLLQDLGPKVASRLGDRALRAAARTIIKEAKRLVPVRTGRLRRSIVGVASKKGRDANQRLVQIGFRPPASRRAHFTEFGTKNHSARPFMRPALDSKHIEALTVMVNELAKGIEREEWKQATALGGEIIEIE